MEGKVEGQGKSIRSLLDAIEDMLGAQRDIYAGAITNPNKDKR